MQLVQPFFLAALEHIGEGVFFLDEHRQVFFFNQAAAQMCGVDIEEAAATPIAELVILHDADAPDTSSTAPLESLLSHALDGPVCGRFFLQHRAGHRLPIELRLLAVHNEAGIPIGIQGIMTNASGQVDITQVNRCLHKLIRIDSLTHLPNQRALVDAMKTEYLRYARYGIPFAVIATALDTHAGSEPSVQRTATLQWFARQLTGALRKSDTPGRLRGNLFFVLLPHTDAAAAARAARKIQERLRRFPCPQAPALTASFGCAAISRKDTLERLQERARRALYRASNDGGNQVVVL